MEFKIGNKLREVRKQKKISIAELSKISEVSTGLISQIERDLVVPSVVSLWRLAKALDVNINYFFDVPPEDNSRIIRRGDHKIISTHHNQTFYKMLNPFAENRLLDFIEIRLEGGGVYEGDAVRHEGEECGYVLKGVLTVLLNEKEYTLYEGDSIYFNSTLPHKYINHSKEECLSIWAMSPPFF